MRRLISTAGLVVGVVALASTGAHACGWSSKTVAAPDSTKTVMAPQTPAPKPSTGG